MYKVIVHLDMFTLITENMINSDVSSSDIVTENLNQILQKTNQLSKDMLASGGLN